MNNSFEVSFLVLEAQEVTDAICHVLVLRRKLRVLCPLYFTGNKMDTKPVACNHAGVQK